MSISDTIFSAFCFDNCNVYTSVHDIKRKNIPKTGRNFNQKRSLSRNDTYSTKKDGKLGYVSTEKGNHIAVVEDGTIQAFYSGTGSRPATSNNHNWTLYQQHTSTTSQHGSEHTFKNDQG